MARIDDKKKTGEDIRSAISKFGTANIETLKTAADIVFNSAIPAAVFGLLKSAKIEEDNKGLFNDVITTISFLLATGYIQIKEVDDGK